VDRCGAGGEVFRRIHGGLLRGRGVLWGSQDFCGRRCGLSRTRTAIPAQRMTTMPPRMVVQSSVSPSRSQAQQRLSTGWASWIWLTWAMGPMATPRYQAKRPVTGRETGGFCPAVNCRTFAPKTTVCRRLVLTHRKRLWTRSECHFQKATALSARSPMHCGQVSASRTFIGQHQDDWRQ
jgi:hypothetical protein